MVVEEVELKRNRLFNRGSGVASLSVPTYDGEGLGCQLYGMLVSRTFVAAKLENVRNRTPHRTKWTKIVQIYSAEAPIVLHSYSCLAWSKCASPIS